MSGDALGGGVQHCYSGEGIRGGKALHEASSSALSGKKEEKIGFGKFADGLADRHIVYRAYR